MNQGDVVRTPPGSFPCKAIFHVCGEQDAGVIEQLVCCIVQHCESFRYASVAIPAICAGKYCVKDNLEKKENLFKSKVTRTSLSLIYANLFIG